MTITANGQTVTVTRPGFQVTVPTGGAPGQPTPIPNVSARTVAMPIWSFPYIMLLMIVTVVSTALKRRLGFPWWWGVLDTLGIATPEAAAYLDHHNIVPIHEVGEHEGRRFLACEYAAGETVRQALAGGPLPPRRAVPIHPVSPWPGRVY